ncbi:MAG TPA: bifunctional hydroxymethylpyrimidine kinase/phosphomethylpyrimidine kinase [Acidimicrobiales bacterium]|nr:bifunctional hydroxymethylpyrimidine kinase/phosphomethylpyrimidine kinase [Acidimicrobiales bacterium]
MRSSGEPRHGTPPVAMTIAGSDSGAGAGLQADLKAFSALGVFATTVVTAVTAQSTAAVAGVEVVPPEMVDLQLRCVLDDMAVAAVKTGMLGSSAVVELVGSWAARGALPNLVVDPVLVSSTGRPLLDAAGPRAYVERLLPHAVVLTPNLREAETLCGLEAGTIADRDAMADAARRLADLGPRVVVLKGGHLGGDDSPDVVVDEGSVSVLEATRVASANTHGTGCTLSAAIAAGLARGLAPIDAVERAKAFVGRAIAGAASWRLGAGHGPLDPFGWSEGEPARPEGDRA